VSPYLPNLGDLAALLTTWGIAAPLLLAGAGIVRCAPEFQIASGWGALSLWLTSWGVFSPTPLYGPALAFVVAAFLVLVFRRCRPSSGAWAALGRMLVLSLPLWLVMAPIRPSQPDTFLNLLPNAFYLVDHGRFPAAGLPPSFSYLPGAPYNTQFLSFLGSFSSRGYPASGMSLVNVMLTLVGALAIARALAAEPGSPAKPPSWALVATGFLLATLFNPGFIPRFDFSAMGETALATLTLLAALLIAEGQGFAAARKRPGAFIPLAFVLAALVNSKQGGIGLLLALFFAAFASASLERASKPAVGRPAALFALLPLAFLPALFLYAIWGVQVAHAGVAELRPLPFALWNWRDLPQMLSSALKIAGEKTPYFAAVAAAFVLLPVLLRRHGWTRTTRLLTLHAALFLLYNGFVFFTYVAVFPAVMSTEAHSFFRYNTHLSLVLVLSLALAARDLGIARALGETGLRVASVAMLALMLLAPIGFIARLRFDLAMPQPLVWKLARNLAPYLENESRLALILPGDNGSLDAMLSGLLRFAPPRHPGLEILTRREAGPQTLADAARRGYTLAFLSCTQKGLFGLPPRKAALLRRDASGWHELALWPYPANMTKRRWQYILSWRPLCRPA
jgi:hypothetical protein